MEQAIAKTNLIKIGNIFGKRIEERRYWYRVNLIELTLKIERARGKTKFDSSIATDRLFFKNALLFHCLP